ncbi:MAG TPA: hypothetical protein VIY29_21210 [Ktedonobacteraceae bacterium]
MLAPDAVADMGGLRRVDHPDDLQLDARRQHLEEPSATAEEHRDQVDLHLVQHRGFERPLRRVRAMHQHVAIPSGGLGLCHRALDPIGHVGHQRIVGHRGTRRPVTDHEDGDAVVVPAPVIDLLRKPPTHEDCASCVYFVYQLSSLPGRSEELPVWSGEPLMQPHEAVAAGVAHFVVGAGDVAVKGHRHVEH